MLQFPSEQTDQEIVGGSPRQIRRTVDNSDSQRGRALLQIRELLLRGELPPGERVFEVPLAQRLGVSRTPIRLALERLAQEGLLEPAGAAGGFTVREFTMRDVWDALEARGVLEGAAARLAAERLRDKSELESMVRIHKQMGHLAEPYLFSPSGETPLEVMVQYIEMNGAFHAALMEMAKSPMLEWSLSRIKTIPFVSPTATGTAGEAGGLLISEDQHRSILEAIGNREGARAEMLTREHARFAGRFLEAARK